MTSVTQYFARLSAEFGEGWNRFWFSPSDSRLTSLLRLLTGLLATYYLFSHTADLIRWFGPYGLLPIETVSQLIGGGAGEYPFRPTYLSYLQTPGLLWAVHALAILIAIAFTLGLYSRLTNLLTLVAVLAYIHRAPMITGQFEPILTMMLCYLMLAPSGTSWSLNHRFRKMPAVGNGPTQSLGANISLRLIQLHVCGVYALMGLSMLNGQVWWTGEAVWWLIARPDSRLLDLTWLHNSIYAINLWTHAIVLVALLFPVLIWHRRTRPLLLAVAAVLWISIGLLTGLLAFAAAMFVASLAFLRFD